MPSLKALAQIFVLSLAGAHPELCTANFQGEGNVVGEESLLLQGWVGFFFLTVYAAFLAVFALIFMC